jgi:hypothetical protein
VEILWDALVQVFWILEWFARATVRSAIYLFGGKFIPDTCAWCRVLWMAGLAGATVFGIWNLQGPRK